MKINIGVVGRFQAFNLAKEFKKNNTLNQLITTYPEYIVKKWGFSKKEIKTYPLLEILNRIRKKIYFDPRKINSYINSRFAKNCCKHLKDCDYFIGYSTSSLETLICAKKKNITTILERTSSHHTFQMNILDKEFKLIENQSYKINYINWQRALLEYELADYISVPSEFVLNTFLEKGYDRKKFIVNNFGVNLKEFYSLPNVIVERPFRAIFVGNASFRKGFHYLLKAANEIDLPNFEIWHVGTVDDEIKRFLKLNKIKKNIIFKGPKKQDELYKYYNQCDIFILPSLEEGFAMVIFQAMACGLPVIASENTGYVDLTLINKNLKKNVLKIRNIENIKERISYYYHNPKILKLEGLENSKMIKENYSWEAYGKRYLNNLEKIKKT